MHNEMPEYVREAAAKKLPLPEISQALAKSFAAQYMDFRKANPDETLDNYLEICGITGHRDLYVKAVQPHVIPAGSTREESVMEACNIGSAPTSYRQASA